MATWEELLQRSNPNKNIVNPLVNNNLANNNSVQTTQALVNPGVGQLTSGEKMGRPAGATPVGDSYPVGYNPQAKLNEYQSNPQIDSNGRNASNIQALQNQIGTNNFNKDYLNQTLNLNPLDRVAYNRYTSNEAISGRNPQLPNDYFNQVQNRIYSPDSQSISFNTNAGLIQPQQSLSNILSSRAGSNTQEEDYNSIVRTEKTNLNMSNPNSITNNVLDALKYIGPGMIGNAKNIANLTDGIANTISPAITSNELLDNRQKELVRMENERRVSQSNQQKVAPVTVQPLDYGQALQMNNQLDAQLIVKQGGLSRASSVIQDSFRQPIFTPVQQQVVNPLGNFNNRLNQYSNMNNEQVSAIDDRKNQLDNLLNDVSSQEAYWRDLTQKASASGDLFGAIGAGKQFRNLEKTRTQLQGQQGQLLNTDNELSKQLQNKLVDQSLNSQYGLSMANLNNVNENQRLSTKNQYDTTRDANNNANQRDLLDRNNQYQTQKSKLDNSTPEKATQQKMLDIQNFIEKGTSNGSLTLEQIANGQKLIKQQSSLLGAMKGSGEQAKQDYQSVKQKNPITGADMEIPVAFKSNEDYNVTLENAKQKAYAMQFSIEHQALAGNQKEQTALEKRYSMVLDPNTIKQYSNNK